MNFIIDQYKNKRKEKQLSFHYEKKYAFVGVGNHSLSNIYPVLDYLHVPLKYIVTRSKNTSDIINKSDWDVEAISDYETALNDPEIGGVFISASPKSHFSLVLKALEHNKHVFVEKPPCFTSDELHELIRKKDEKQRIVLCGLQKRYAPAYSILKKKMKNVQHYSLRYCTGAYPEGNAITDLFIHPMDIVCYMFGAADVKSVMKSNEDTLLIHVIHPNNVMGTIELSTAYSWQDAIEHLTVVTKNGIFELNTLAELIYKAKSPVVYNIPLEKVVKLTPEVKVLFKQNPFLPTIEQNSIYVHGFYSEINHFVHLCEGKGEYTNNSDLSSLISIYKVLEKLQSE